MTRPLRATATTMWGELSTSCRRELRGRGGTATMWCWNPALQGRPAPPGRAVAWSVRVAGLGCFWRSYAPRVRTHGEVMVSIAHKAVDLVATGRFTAESMPELTYPLERADAFARQARERAGREAPPSLTQFEALIARYRAFVDAVDRTRREQRGADAAAALAGPRRAVEDAAAAVNETLRREG